MTPVLSQARSWFWGFRTVADCVICTCDAVTGPELTPAICLKTLISREKISPGSVVICPPTSLCRIKARDMPLGTDVHSCISQVPDPGPTGQLCPGNHRVTLLQGKSIINSSTWGTGVRFASVHCFFPKENVQLLLPHLTTRLHGLSAYF